MAPGDVCMQVYRTDKGTVRQVRKVRIVSAPYGPIGAGIVMVQPMYGPLRHDTYPIHVSDLVAVA